MGIATLIIVFGCGGEYLFGGRASTAAAQLQDASDRQIASLVLAAKTEDGKIVTAQKDAAKANERAGQANERAAKLEAQAAEFRREAEQAKLETARLQSQVNWRHLTPEQVMQLADFAKKTPVRANFTTVQRDPEAQNFCAEIQEAVGLAPPGKGFCFTLWETVVGIHVPDGTPALSNVQALADLLAQFGYSSSPIDKGASVPPELVIGSKPPPNFPIK